MGFILVTVYSQPLHVSGRSLGLATDIKMKIVESRITITLDYNYSYMSLETL
jgi:hypothetical protein